MLAEPSCKKEGRSSSNRRYCDLPPSAPLNLVVQLLLFTEIVMREARTGGVSKKTSEELASIVPPLCEKWLSIPHANQVISSPPDSSALLRRLERLCEVCGSNVVCSNIDSQSVLGGDALLGAVGKVLGKRLQGDGELLNSRTCRMFLRVCRLRGIRPLGFLDSIGLGGFQTRRFEILDAEDHLICLQSCLRTLQRLLVIVRYMNRQQVIINSTDARLQLAKQESESCWNESLTIWKRVKSFKDPEDVRSLKIFSKVRQVRVEGA